MSTCWWCREYLMQIFWHVKLMWTMPDCSMNWLSPPAEPPNDESAEDPEAPSESNLNYWAARLQPLHDPTPSYSSGVTGGADPSSSEFENDKEKEVVFVACNRVGTEEGEPAGHHTALLLALTFRIA